MRLRDAVNIQVAIDALVADTPASKHSQTCPVWSRRARGPGPDACDCWIRWDAEHAVNVVLDALDPSHAAGRTA